MSPPSGTHHISASLGTFWEAIHAENAGVYVLFILFMTMYYNLS